MIPNYQSNYFLQKQYLILLQLSKLLESIYKTGVNRITTLPRLEQKRDMKSPVVIRSTLVSRAFRINLKQRPISFLLILLTAHISC
jgi:hypothetical protein